ncbi:ABC transporter ATP-binding protein [Roseococcus sp. SYP-B2431]|uniref:ABC transporter ATP-binding protein n=1 Tax=Roseococcus sp. SYP-B2431 TaxID=2496640 RepID=UPI00103E5CBF|nr:ABC transporter ATP-binding protein [Roseococcus sp. SYP-B2431]TCH99675.1 ABC transporter ATP-binding protein [Roseococcus sp. SYP-B2431]
MSTEVSIRAEGLFKAYRVYADPKDRLRQAVFPRLGWLLSRLAPPLARRLRDRSYFTEFWALRDLSFEAVIGESIGIVGRNGSGKSTLLQIVCGTLTPSLGSVTVRGRIAALLELGSGFNPEYTGRENIFLNASVLGLAREEIEARLDDIIAFAEIGAFIDQPIKTYSSGMAMRLAFAVVAHVDADVLVIDEALAVGDAIFQQKCFRWLRGFQERGILLYCGHDTGAILGLCQKAIWIDRGDVRMAGPARDVMEAYNIFVHSGQLPPEAPVAARAPGPVADPAPGPAMALADPSRGLRMEGERTSYGSGQAEIAEVTLARVDGQPLAWIVGGEEVELAFRIEARSAILGGIAGIVVKDRLGQPILGENTADLYADAPIDLPAGGTAQAVFRFRMPALRRGSYSISPAFASGTLANHVQHHWIHDAIVFEVHPTRDVGAVMLLEVSHRGIERLPERAG